MAQQSAGMPYIGSLISLISKTGVRYEGTLYTIDMVESTIALQDGMYASRATSAQSRYCELQSLRRSWLAVRSFGTEGRKQDGPQIPASERPFEFIIFRGDCCIVSTVRGYALQPRSDLRLQIVRLPLRAFLTCRH